MTLVFQPVDLLFDRWCLDLLYSLEPLIIHSCIELTLKKTSFSLMKKVLDLF